MIDTLFESIIECLTWPIFRYIILGALLGHILGLIPGLAAAIGMALVLPITYGMSPSEALVLLSSIMGGAAFGGSIPAILLNAPGTPGNAATAFDGFPLTLQGKAKEALGAAAAASCLGAWFGVLAFILLIPFMRTIVLALGPPEWFLMAILGLMLIASISEGSLIIGLLAGCFGFILSFIGQNPVAGGFRFVFGSIYLWDGIQIIPLILGLFAIAEMINLYTKQNTLSKTGELAGGSVFEGVKTVFKNFNLFIRCAIIGVLIGVIPGTGGTIATFISYFHAKTSSKNPDSFGRGNIQGVIASEAANDSKDAGALIPLLTLGIPGSVGSAIFLGALIMHGVVPGREMFTVNLPIVFYILIALAFSNLITVAIGLTANNLLAKLTIIPLKLLAPVVFTFCLIGSYGVRGSITDVFTALLFGILGYLMIHIRFPRVPVVLAYVLGPVAERSFVNSLQISDHSYLIFVTRPISLLLIALIILSLFLTYYRAGAKKDKIRVF